MSNRTGALDSVIFGVDVQQGDVRGEAPSFALVVFDGETIERDVVTHRKLRRRVDAEAPAILATDNVYELAEDRDALVRFLDWLPPETRLVQVTGGHQPEPLSRVASRHGVPYGKDPMAEAEAATRLAAASVGQAVTAFTDTTEVKVARGRSTGGGGWSEDRYTRKIHGAVRRKTREVESTLEDAGLDFERDVTEKYGGFANAIFTVQARPADIPVSPMRSGDIRVEVERQRRDGIEFEPLAKRRDHVIVGIDPGTTTAAAVLDLDGGLLDVVSTRTADTADVVEWLVERGRPIIVAADVTPMPDTVEKIRRSFDAAGWEPDRDLPVDVKKHRTREVGYDNDHERDAIAAALAASDDHSGQFERVAEKVPARRDLGAVLDHVVAGGESVETALDMLGEDGSEQTEEESPEPPEPSPEQRRITQLEEQIAGLEAHVERLEDDLEAKEDAIDDYEEQLTDAKREERREVRERREVTRLRRENERLERELADREEEVTALEEKIERLKTLWKLDHSDFADVAEQQAGLVPVKVVDQFTTDAIEAAHESYGLAEDDVVFLRDASGAGWSTAERLADVGPRLVVRTGQFSEMADRVLFDNEIPTAPADLVTVQEVDELAVARESEVESAIADWESRASDRKRQQSSEMVDRLISEHRADRENGVE